MSDGDIGSGDSPPPVGKRESTSRKRRHDDSLDILRLHEYFQSAAAGAGKQPPTNTNINERSPLKNHSNLLEQNRDVRVHPEQNTEDLGTTMLGTAKLQTLVPHPNSNKDSCMMKDYLVRVSTKLNNCHQQEANSSIAENEPDEMKPFHPRHERPRKESLSLSANTVGGLATWVRIGTSTETMATNAQNEAWQKQKQKQKQKPLWHYNLNGGGENATKDHTTAATVATSTQLRPPLLEAADAHKMAKRPGVGSLTEIGRMLHPSSGEEDLKSSRECSTEEPLVLGIVQDHNSNQRFSSGHSPQDSQSTLSETRYSVLEKATTDNDEEAFPPKGLKKAPDATEATTRGGVESPTNAYENNAGIEGNRDIVHDKTQTDSNKNTNIDDVDNMFRRLIEEEKKKRSIIESNLLHKLKHHFPNQEAENMVQKLNAKSKAFIDAKVLKYKEEICLSSKPLSGVYVAPKGVPPMFEKETARKPLYFCGKCKRLKNKLLEECFCRKIKTPTRKSEKGTSSSSSKPNGKNTMYSRPTIAGDNGQPRKYKCGTCKKLLTTGCTCDTSIIVVGKPDGNDQDDMSFDFNFDVGDEGCFRQDQ